MRPDDDRGEREDRLSAEEIERRKKLRSGLRVERAVNQPGGRPAPVTSPREGEKE